LLIVDGHSSHLNLRFIDYCDKIVLSWPYSRRIQHTAYSLLMSVFSRHSPTPIQMA
jgi:hypothetical protein